MQISPDGGVGVPQDEEMRRDVTRDFSTVEPVRGPARLPYPVEGQVPAARMPGFDPGAFSIRVLLDKDSAGGYT